MSIPVPKKAPPEQPTPSVQMDLFRWFLANDDGEVSNTVEVWDSIPKYFFTPKQMEKLRTASGHADPYKWAFEFQGKPCEVRIQPALIEQEDGSYKAFFPSVTEELVEEALKKVLTEQRYGIHDTAKAETWVRFTLKMVQKELKQRGKSRSVTEIKHAIEVMSACVIALSVGGKEVWKGAILQDLTTVGREEYLADTEAHHVARLPLFVSHSINKLQYRQFNYSRLMNCKEQLSRWIYRRLINRYKQASFANDYHFMHSDLERSGLLQQTTPRDNRKKAQSALKELVDIKVLRSYHAEPRHEGRKIVDVKYTVVPAMEFISEQKAANKRHTEVQQRALKAGVKLPVDKLS